MSPPSPPSTNMRLLPALGVEVRDESTLLRSRLALASNWFSVDRLQITCRDGDVRLYRDRQLIARSGGGDVLFVSGQRLQAQKARNAAFWRPVWTLPMGNGCVVEISSGGGGVYRKLRVTPGDACLEVISEGLGWRRGCRINLVSGLVETELALHCLVYFLADLEEIRRFNP